MLGFTGCRGESTVIKSRFFLVAISLPALMISVPALAGEVADSASPSWSGPFLGLAGGFAAANITTIDQSVPGQSNEVVYQFSDQDAVYSVHAGFDHVFGERYVGGVEVGADWLGFSLDPQASGGFGTAFSADYDLTLTGRLGVLVNPKTLVYGRVGAGLTSLRADQGFSGTATTLLPAAIFGAGVETMLGGNLSGRLEANYNLPVKDFTIPSDSEAFNPHYLRITAGLDWHLDNGHPVTLAALEPARPAFAGGYLGIIGGYRVGQMFADVSTPGATVGPFASDTPSLGGTLGYDVRLDRFVAGVGVDAQAMNADFFDPAQNSPLQGSTKLFGNISGTAMVTARAGVMLDPSTLFYVKGGVGYVRTTANPEFFTFGSGGTRWLQGHEFGLGVESMLTDAIGLKLEGLYTAADQPFVVDLTQTDQAMLSPSTLSATAGLTWHY